MYRRPKHILIAAIACAILAASADRAGAISFTTFDDPLGVKGTLIFGISGDAIVGSFLDAQSIEHGFIHDSMGFHTFDNPLGVKGSTVTSTDGSLVVGNFIDSAGNTHGYIYNGTSFSTIDYPGGVPSTWLGDTDGARFVGYYLSGGLTHGFVYDGTTFTPIEEVGAHGSAALGVEGTKVVGETGHTDTLLQATGYTYDGSSFTTLRGTPFASVTVPFAIHGDTVVGYTSASGGLQGFIENAGNYTLFRDPNDGGGIHGTLAYDFQVNTIVGGYYDAAGVPHGFIATVPEPSTATLMLIAAGALIISRLKRRA
jgi:hypothetical protein